MPPRPRREKGARALSDVNEQRGAMNSAVKMRMTFDLCASSDGKLKLAAKEENASPMIIE